MERHFTIIYPDDYGEMWFNKDNLMLCINAYCDNTERHITASDITEGFKQLQADNAALRSELNTATCTWCGFKIHNENAKSRVAQITEHIVSCEKNISFKLYVENEELKKENERIKKYERWFTIVHGFVKGVFWDDCKIEFDEEKALDDFQKMYEDNAALRANLMALLTALEVKEIDDLMTKNQEYFSKLGEVIKDNITDRDIKITTLRERLARLVEAAERFEQVGWTQRGWEDCLQKLSIAIAAAKEPA